MSYFWLLCVLLAAGGGILYHRGCRQEWERRLEMERAASAQVIEAERHGATFAQAQQRALFESMVEGVLLVGRDGRILMANKSLRELFQVSTDLRGKTILEAFRIPTLAAMVSQLPRQGVMRGAEISIPLSGSPVLEVNASAILDQAGSYHGAIFVLHDLTRLRELENTRREFVANVSHELRTPLSLIKGFVETLLDGASSHPEQAERFLHTILKHTNRLTYLIEDLLTISRLESGPAGLSFQSVVINDVAQRVIDDLEGKAAERKITLANEVPGDLAVQADADRLQQVVFNLVENAIKYGRECGRVTIRAILNEAGVATVAVEDDGPGIPREAQTRVFERFYRVDRARSRETGGTGLGLSIVKHIVQAHGGQVAVKSEPGHGALFHFTLPRACRKPVALEQAPEVAEMTAVRTAA